MNDNILRTVDFNMMEVKNIEGKRQGFIKDLCLDFNKGIITGFSISSYKLFKNEQIILKEDIVSFSNFMIIKKVQCIDGFTFSKFKGMDVVDIYGHIIGVVEDILFYSNFDIYGVVLSLGFFKDMNQGKRILLTKELILGEKSILIKSEKKFIFTSRMHWLFTAGSNK